MLEYKQTKRNNQRLTLITIVIIILIAGSVSVAKALSNNDENQLTPIEFNYTKLPALGNPNASVQIVEFGDYKCPACQRFSQNVMPDLKVNYIDTGKVTFYFHHFTFIGPDSTTAALAAQSVFHQNANVYWDYYDAIYRNQGNERKEWATSEYLTQLAKEEQLPIDYDALKQEIDSKRYQAEIDEQNAFTKKIGVTETPTLFINGFKYKGKMTYAAVAKAIEEQIDSQTK